MRLNEQMMAAEGQAGPIANIEAEAALLGAMMLANQAVDRVAEKLEADHFFEPLHGRIYSAIVRECSLGRTANPVTIRPYFIDDETMRAVGGPAYLAQLTGSGASIIGMHDFAAQILELAQRRALLAALEAIAVRDFDKTFPEICAEAESAIAEIGRESGDGLIERSGAECIDAALRAAESQDRRGVLCGVDAIDQALGPIRKKQMIVLAARPGMGKSVTASSYALGAARRGHGVLFFSLEMSDEEIGARMASDLSLDMGRGVPLSLIEKGAMNRDQYRVIMQCRDELAKLPLQVIDIGQSTTGRMNGLIRRWKRRFAARGQSLDLVVIDYMQKLRPDYRAKDLYQAITEVSQSIKSCAKTNDIGILALAQLSRAVESRADHRPQLSDLRDSGQIEQDADGVLFLYRPEYYLNLSEPGIDDPARAKWEMAMEASRGEIEFICAKRRQGRTGKTIGQFYGQFQAVR